jgi:hypothetical protein
MRVRQIKRNGGSTLFVAQPNFLHTEGLSLLLENPLIEVDISGLLAA